MFHNARCNYKSLMHLLNIWWYTTFSYAFRRMSAPSSGSLIFNCSIFGASTGCNPYPKVWQGSFKKS